MPLPCRPKYPATVTSPISQGWEHVGEAPLKMRVCERGVAYEPISSPTAISCLKKKSPRGKKILFFIHCVKTKEA